MTISSIIFRGTVRFRARVSMAQTGHQLPERMIESFVSHTCPCLQEIETREDMPDMVAFRVSRRPFFLLMISATRAMALFLRVAAAAFLPHLGHQWPSWTLEGVALKTWPSAHSQRSGSVVFPAVFERHLPLYRDPARAFQNSIWYFVDLGIPVLRE
jgi:hypothetical protein